MSDGLRAQVDATIGRLRALIWRGQEYCTQNTQNHLGVADSVTSGSDAKAISADSADSAGNSSGAVGSDVAALRIWQRDCAELVNELSGGSKAHWLSRAYSEALL